MQNRLENTSSVFENRVSLFSLVATGTMLVVLVLIGGLISANSGNWPAALIFILVLLGLVGYLGFIRFRFRRMTSRLGLGQIEWSSAIPELQRQSLNIEVRELSRILDVGDGQLTDLQSAYIVAEDLALRQIQHEEGVPILRHVSVAEVPFDAVFQKDGVLVCCEVVFLVSPELRRDRINSMLKKIAQTKTAIESKGKVASVRLMMILVTQMVSSDEELLRAFLKKENFAETPVDIDIRLLDFESLQRLYITE
ncbi:hypothetical protein [Leptolyngbya sp. 7M]|uniref:hypothetical protein n=1 Tax=Leptolyngbya sp. 7M TaxID=2812896 RepID=UPI001B8AFCC4|nr:hypothetical protein [Leptolyngbya sp. 7M]QYO65437.1 hypothetical protein JVX88_01225 [Leptolyngbya sp. 7M]